MIRISRIHHPCIMSFHEQLGRINRNSFWRVDIHSTAPCFHPISDILRISKSFSPSLIFKKNKYYMFGLVSSMILIIPHHQIVKTQNQPKRYFRWVIGSYCYVMVQVMVAHLTWCSLFSFDTRTSEFKVKGNGTYIFHLHVMSQEFTECYAYIMLNDQHHLPVHGDARNG